MGSSLDLSRLTNFQNWITQSLRSMPITGTSLNRKERFLFPSLPGTNRATFTAVRSRISQPFSGGFKRKEKWKSSLNPWCLFLDAVLSFEEITPIKVRISIKFRHWMPADLEIWKFEKFGLFGLKNPFPGTFRNPILIKYPFTTFLWVSPFSPSPGDFPYIWIKFLESILSHYVAMIVSPSSDYLVKILDEFILCPWLRITDSSFELLSNRFDWFLGWFN